MFVAYLDSVSESSAVRLIDEAVTHILLVYLY